MNFLNLWHDFIMKKIKLKINSVVKFEIFSGIDPFRIRKDRLFGMILIMKPSFCRTNFKKINQLIMIKTG